MGIKKNDEDDGTAKNKKKMEEEAFEVIDLPLRTAIHPTHNCLYHVRSRSIGIYPVAGGVSRNLPFRIDRKDSVNCHSIGGSNNSILMIGTNFGTISFLNFRSGYCLE